LGARDIPLATGERHVKAFERAGWRVARKQGSHVILNKEGMEPILSIPCKPGHDVPRQLVYDQVRLAGLTEDEYVQYFRGKRP
jgi:predicted RNA binding protein YcfA (HicA-like mRNA interferase family)